MVDPDIGSKFWSVSLLSLGRISVLLTNTNSIPIISKDLLDRQVSDNDILLALHKTRLRVSSAFQPFEDTHSPNPTSLAEEFFPMMLVLLPTLT